MDAAVEAAKGAGGAPHGAGSAKLARRIKLRLDDGSLIVDAALVGLGNNGAAAGGAGGGGGGVVHLPTTASNAGEKELERLQRLLAIPELPDANGFEVRRSQAAAPRRRAAQRWCVQERRTVMIMAIVCLESRARACSPWRAPLTQTPLRPRLPIACPHAATASQEAAARVPTKHIAGARCARLAG